MELSKLHDTGRQHLPDAARLWSRGTAQLACLLVERSCHARQRRADVAQSTQPLLLASDNARGRRAPKQVCNYPQGGNCGELVSLSCVNQACFFLPASCKLGQPHASRYNAFKYRWVRARSNARPKASSSAAWEVASSANHLSSTCASSAPPKA